MNVNDIIALVCETFLEHYLKIMRRMGTSNSRHLQELGNATIVSRGQVFHFEEVGHELTCISFRSICRMLKVTPLSFGTEFLNYLNHTWHLDNFVLARELPRLT
jgi:hypothetical protein